MSGSQTIGGVILLIIAFFLVLPAAAQDNTVTRSGSFTITVIGIPRTPYDIWVSGTNDMSGEPGDQPPVIAPGQVDVQQDDPGGPYVIGSTPVRGGGTILDDVAPSSSVVPATSYYALVTTDIQGYGRVLFRTSANTATDRQFHIAAQNPANQDENIQVVLGVPTPVPTPMMPLPLPTTMETPLLPPPATPVPVTPVPPAPIPTTLPATATPITPSPEETPTETAPVQGIPLPVVIVIPAAGIGLLLAAGRKGAG